MWGVNCEEEGERAVGGPDFARHAATGCRVVTACVVALLVLTTVLAGAASKRSQGDKAAEAIASLIEPAKLATLGERGANPRVQKYVFQLATAQANGAKPKAVAEAAGAQAGYTNELARKLTVAAMLRNLDIATKPGCLDADGLDEMRHGKARPFAKAPTRATSFPLTTSSRAPSRPNSTT